MNLITFRKRGLGQGNVIPSVHMGEGVGFPACITGHIDHGGVLYLGGGGVEQTRPPPELEKQAVCILLECFLVYLFPYLWMYFNSNLQQDIVMLV